MDTLSAITKRHSYRDAFAPKAIPREQLIQIVSAGLAAPSGCNKQTTEFMIVDDPALLSKIAGLAAGKVYFQTAPAFILCLTNANPEPAVYNLSFELQDCAAAVENMLLAITSLEYAAVWIDGWLKAEGRAEKIAALLNIPKTKTLQVILPLGIPIKSPTPPPKKSFDERVCFNTYSLN